MLRLACAASFLLAGPGPAAAAAPQQPAAVTPTAPGVQAPTSLDTITVAALEHLAAQLAELRQQQATAVAGSGDAAAAARFAERQQQLGWQFAGLAARIDVQDFEAPLRREFDLQQELEQLLRPLLSALKSATAGPRQISDLEARLERLQQRRLEAEQAQRTVERTRDALPAASLARAEAQREIDGRWRRTIEALRGDALLVEAQLQTLRQARTSLFDDVTRIVREFVQKSGLSLALAALVFTSLFFGLRTLPARLLRRRGRAPTFTARLLLVVAQVLTVVVAIAGALVVAYVRDDWLLLAIGIVFLLGAGWALMRTLPLVLEQVRLMLNVGGVREGERLVVDGVPYRVDALRLLTRLSNPALRGGELRLPIKDLIGRRSRAAGADEPWFPCQVGEVVALADGVLGSVRTQTPELVVVAERDDAPRSYATAAFLALSPRNLSRGFCITTAFAIDLAHEPAQVLNLPATLQGPVVAHLAAAVAAGELRALRLEFRGVRGRGHEFTAVAEFAGGPALRYRELERHLQAALFAAVAQHGYRPARTQLTVLRADA